MSDETNKDTPTPPAGEPTPPAAAPKPPAGKPNFKVTRSPFAPKVGGTGQTLPTTGKPAEGDAPKAATSPSPIKPPSAAPTSKTMPPKPSAAAPKPAPVPTKPKPASSAPAEALESESAGIGIGMVAFDGLCAIVAIVFGVLIFMGVQG